MKEGIGSERKEEGRKQRNVMRQKRGNEEE